MDAWVWILIAIVVLVILQLVRRQNRKRKRDQLQEQFGPEYDRAVKTKGGRSEAESELQARASCGTSSIFALLARRLARVTNARGRTHRRISWTGRPRPLAAPIASSKR